jgi:hypothetical protein
MTVRSGLSVSIAKCSLYSRRARARRQRLPCKAGQYVNPRSPSPNHPLRLRARAGSVRRWRSPRGIRWLRRGRAGRRNSRRPCYRRRGAVQRDRFTASAWCGRPLWHWVNRRLFPRRRRVPGCEPGADLLLSARRVIAGHDGPPRCVFGLRCAACEWRGRSRGATGLGRTRCRLTRRNSCRLRPRGCCRARVHHCSGAHIDRRRGNRIMRARREKNADRHGSCDERAAPDRFAFAHFTPFGCPPNARGSNPESMVKRRRALAMGSGIELSRARERGGPRPTVDGATQGRLNRGRSRWLACDRRGVPALQSVGR